MLRNGFLMLAAAPIVAVSTAKESSNEIHLKRPQDLPIYSTLFPENKAIQQEEQSVARQSIQSGVKVVREGCCDCVNTIKAQKKPIDEFVSTGIDHSQFIVDYLNRPTNGIHRVGAIAVGALSGYIIGIRRGFIRRLLYASFGGLGVASLCYPKEAEKYSQQAIEEAKTYATIFYNFAYGVKPGDEPKPLPIPSNLSDFTGSVKKLFTFGSKSEK